MKSGSEFESDEDVGEREYGSEGRLEFVVAGGEAEGSRRGLAVLCYFLARFAILPDYNNCNLTSSDRPSCLELRLP